MVFDRTSRWLALLGLLVLSAQVEVAHALDQVTFRHLGRPLSVDGKVLVEAQDGGLLFQARDGKIWAIKPEDLQNQRSDQTPFTPLTQAELGRQLLQELPAGFKLHTTKNYLIAYNTSDAYAEWCGSLFERLYNGFRTYWKNRVPLHDPEFPLVAIVFADQKSYANHAETELGPAVSNIIGYYSFATNYMTMYDLTGVQALNLRGERKSKAAEINALLSRPQAERTVATIIHEATHQIAFNCGLQTRYADNPLWFSEGIAMYFETPDLKNGQGWSAIGKPNRVRLVQFFDGLKRRPAGALTALLQEDQRLRDPKQMESSYAESWALCYFLLKTRAKESDEYFQLLAKKERLIWDEPAARVEDFRRCFGDLDALERDFLRYMKQVR